MGPESQPGREENDLAAVRGLIRQAGIRVQLDSEDLVLPPSPRGFQVTNDILVSHWIPSFNPQFLRQFDIKSILCLDGKHKPEMASDLGVERIVSVDMPDGPGTTTEMVRRLVGQLHELVTEHSATLVQCNAGQSRSASIVAAYLSIYRGYSFSAALATVRDARAPLRNVKYWDETLKAIRPLVGDV
jgi:hypothetical protein